MCYKRKFFFLIFIVTFSICFSQNRKIELEIKGAKTYNNIYIRAFQQYKTPIKFTGETVDGNNWTFTIPDSIVEKSFDFDFKGRNQEGVETLFGFLGVIQEDTLMGYYINFENGDRLIKLKMEYHHTAHKSNNRYDPQIKKTITIQQWDEDYFLIDPNQNHYLRENMIDFSFGFFQSTDGYDEYLSKMASKIKNNPNSVYYLTRLASTLSYYKSKKDLAQLYYLFSNEMQQSYFGKIIYKNISTFKIDNVSLFNNETQKEEKIVSNTNIYTLLIFSASWCVPCHKKIPMLKKIYKESNSMVDMVYITVDDEKTLPNWNKLMHNEKIPWRSLLLNNKELKYAWQIGAIPDYILISSDLKAQKISLNDNNDIKNLYSIIRNK